MKTLLRPVAYFAVTLFAVCAANGQATRTWVSGVGDDANPCSRTAPCLTFAGAISKTANGGEIDTIDPGGFGQVTITKSITIDGSGGTTSGVLAGSGNGIIINAGANAVVTLRNLDINGFNASSSSTNGVNIISAKAVHLEKVVVYGFVNNGVAVNTGAAVNVTIDHSSIHDNTVAGLSLGNAGSGTLTYASITNSTVMNNGTGVLVTGGAKAVAQNVISTGNAGAGFQADGSAGAASINIIGSTASNNGGAGLQASSTGATAATVRITGASVFSNGSAISTGANGNVVSYGDNVISGIGSPTATTAKQ